MRNLKMAFKALLFSIPFTIIMVMLGCEMSNENPDNITKAKDWAAGMVPLDAQIIEYQLTQGGLSSDTPNIYVIYQFRDQCFMIFNGSRRTAITPLDCQ